MISPVLNWSNGIPGQGTIEAALTNVIVRIIKVREGDIRYYPSMLRAFSRYTIELRASQFDLPIIHRNDFLNGTFSKGLPTKNYASLVVLYSTRKNLRGGSTSPIHKNCQWTCVSYLRVIIPKGSGETVSYTRISYLNGGTGLYEESDKLIRLSYCLLYTSDAADE